MTSKAEDVMPLSDNGDAGECDDGTVSPTPATVPKKRGRPAKKSPTERVKGKPAKGADGASNKKPVKTDMSGEEGTASEDGSPVPNGDTGEADAVVSSKRGRPKRKPSNTVEASGKGRGRPKKMLKTDLAEDDEAGDDNDGASSDYKPGKKANTKAAKKGRGRPKKVQTSDEESSDDKVDDDAVRRPVGRPPSGGVNLNIVRTGKGQGRPKKKVGAASATDVKNGDGETKKLGRPVTSGKGPYLPTGNPRGRPKQAAQNKDLQEDEDKVVKSEIPEKVEEKSSDDGDEVDKAKSGSENGD